MIQAFIRIRFKQISRGINGIGLIRFIFLIVILGFFASGVFLQTAETPNSFYAAGLYLSIITLIQVKRQDKRFAKIHFSNFKLIFFIEYMLLMIPLVICLIYHKQWIPVISVIAITLLIVNVDFKQRQKSLNTAIQRLIPSDCFEWKGGVRKTLVLMATLWIVGLGTSFFVGSVPIVLFVFCPTNKYPALNA